MSKKIADQIVSQSGDYFLSFKENQKDLNEEIREIFSYAKAGHSAVDFEKDHGHVESRECIKVKAIEQLVTFTPC